MKLKKFKPVFRGLTAVMASVLTLSTVGYGVADTYRSAVDDVLGTKSYEISKDADAARFKSDYENVDKLYEAAKKHAVRQGEEGTVIMKNDNSVLPLASGKKVALFGAAAYLPYKGDGAAGGLHGGNADQVDLVSSFTKAGVTVDAAPKAIYDKLLSVKVESGGGWGGPSISYTYGINTNIGDMTDYKINEVPANKLAEIAEADANWANAIVKNDTIGICVFQRPGGENNTYAPGTAVNFAGEKTGKDPLALSDDELSIVDLAKEKCSKVIVLLNSANTLEIGAIAKGGAHEVDGIAYIGVPNDFQCEGIVNVLTGKVNATGALPDTYVYDNTSAPAMQNFGGNYFTNYDIASTAKAGADPRFPGQELTNERQTSSFGRNFNMYSGGYYIVEAEGIYVGYNYYETRYYDSVANPSYKANSAKGATQDTTWKYNKEVIYSFGHGLSYLDYEQNIKTVHIDKSNPEGNITAEIEVKNKSDKEGLFLAQLYVQQPYTQYDITNKVEKSAVMFLNSKKVTVAAHGTATVTIEVPAKYLASYDYTNAKTYILDEGDYYFTAAAGAHDAVNNILTKQGKTTADGMDAAGKGSVFVWNNSAFDKSTYATDNGYNVTNVADNADINYWLPGSVTYLSRSNWETTYPENYSAKRFDIATSAKKEEWIKEVRGQQYTINNTGAEAENVEGKDNGVKFTSDYVGLDQINDINDEYWDKLVKSISVDQAVGGVIHGGSQTDEYDIIDNAIIKQYEGPNGINGAKAEGVDYKFNISSQTLLASSFNPELAYEWGVIEGESGLYLNVQTAWGTGLTQRRTPYNSRNLEYISEDPMLTNRIGYNIIAGALSKGFLCGPKHMGFNDQEHTRSGLSVYMTEQKMRETDLRGFQGALDDAHGLAVMVAFNRIGATNASHHVGMLKHIVREEWGFKGLISTDMATNNKYFVAESMIMATITQVADFSPNDNTISKNGGADANWGYISVNNVKNDATLVNQARENLKYQFYAFANSTAMNISTVRVTPWWEATIKAVIITSAILTALAGIGWIASIALPEKSEKKEEE